MHLENVGVELNFSTDRVENFASILLSRYIHTVLNVFVTFLNWCTGLTMFAERSMTRTSHPTTYWLLPSHPLVRSMGANTSVMAQSAIFMTEGNLGYSDVLGVWRLGSSALGLTWNWWPFQSGTPFLLGNWKSFRVKKWNDNIFQFTSWLYFIFILFYFYFIRILIRFLISPTNCL